MIVTQLTYVTPIKNASINMPIETHQSCLYFLHDWRTSSKRITCSASIRMADTHRLNPKTDRSKNRRRKNMSAWLAAFP